MTQEDGSSSVTSSPLQLFSMMSLSPAIGSPYQWLKEMQSEERGLYLIRLLIACANHVSAGSIDNANIVLEQISYLASADGDTMQRMAAYFSEALANRVVKRWSGVYNAMNSTRIRLVSDEVMAKRLFFDLCPFLRLSYLVTNQAILEAMEGEKMVHVVDLCCSEPAQWVNLLQLLKTRPEGPPHLRITGIHQQKEVLERMAIHLNEEAERLDIAFQFNPIVSRLDDLDVESLRYRSGEALAVSSVASTSALTTSSPLSLASSSKIMSFLNVLWTLSPKLMVVTEQESNHNGISLMERVLEALNFYAALFDCLESTVPRVSLERQLLEKMMFGEEIKNIIACEGHERTVRHERLEKWVQRLEFAGFVTVPLSYNGMLLATRLLQSYGYDGYRIKEDNGRLAICWHDQRLYSISAWKFRRYS